MLIIFQFNKIRICGGRHGSGWLLWSTVDETQPGQPDRVSRMASGRQNPLCRQVSRMSVTVKFFASLREHLGRSEAIIDVKEGDTVRWVWSRATGDAPLPEGLLMAVNCEYADAEAPVKDHDEVAFFPPVTGG